MKSYIILMLLVIIAYANSLQNGFVWDDNTLIVNNPKINIPLREIPSVFAASLWETTSFSERQQEYYRPFVSLLYILNYKIFGLNPSGFHLTNILLHLISVIILYKIGLLLFNNDARISFIGASIFAVHPVNNEPIGRAASGEVIFGFFIIIAIYLFLTDKKYLSWIAFFFALLSKEAAVMLPFALVILSIHRNGVKRGAVAIMPYLALAGIYLVIRMKVVDIVLGIDTSQSQPISTRIFTMAAAAFDYIRLLIIPYPLSPFYPARWHASVFEPKVMFAIMVLISVSLLAFKIKRDGAMLFLLASPFIMLAPVIWKVNTFPVGWEFVYIAERFLYMPTMLFSIFISASIIKLFKDRPRAYLNTGCILIVTIFAVLTIFSNRIWKNEIVLFKKITEELPNVSFAHNNLGNIYADQGRLDEAMKEYQIAVELKPDYADARNNLGVIYFELGELDMAVKEYESVLKFYPAHAPAHNNLGNVYYNQGNLDKAEKEYLTALRLKPDYTEAYNNLGRIYDSQQRLNEAIDKYSSALRFNPDYAIAYYNRGIAYWKKKLLSEARKDFEIALKLKPDFTEARKNIESLKRELK
ncbi:MAG: tetratricopeptide repeat protein [Deltaproteobacteria bacterium]|nr:tetratricopeptide repeat protein [Deltaproteobacteria bacterium]